MFWPGHALQTPNPPGSSPHLLLMQVDCDAGLQVGALNFGEVRAQCDLHQVSQDGVSLLQRLGHRGLVGLGRIQRSLHIGSWARAVGNGSNFLSFLRC